MQEKVKDGGASEFNWVGSRPLRPDGVDKVTGRAKFGADLAMQGQLVAACCGAAPARPHPRHRRVGGCQAAGREGDRHAR
jgi:CO/xanthine dehydrogenase Mo-binding subunit